MTELSRYPDSQSGGPIPVDDLDYEENFRQELETSAIHSGKTPQEAETYAHRVSASCKNSYENYMNRRREGTVRLPGAR